MFASKASLKVSVYNTLEFIRALPHTDNLYSKLYRMMITEPVSKQFLRKASELLAGLLSIFGFYTAMFVSVYNITFNQESFGCSVTFLYFPENPEVDRYDLKLDAHGRL